MSKHDISLVLEFVRDNLPDVDAKAFSLNKIAAKALIDGFVAYGWTLAEIAAVRSELICQIDKYVDIAQLVRDEAAEKEMRDTAQSNASATPPGDREQEEEGPRKRRRTVDGPSLSLETSWIREPPPVSLRPQEDSAVSLQEDFPIYLEPSTQESGRCLYSLISYSKCSTDT